MDERGCNVMQCDASANQGIESAMLCFWRENLLDTVKKRENKVRRVLSTKVYGSDFIGSHYCVLTGNL